MKNKGHLALAEYHRNARKKNIEAYQIDPKRCLNCNKELEYDKRRHKFCSHSCSASSNNRGVRRRGNPPSNCLSCGKLLNNSAKKYCNNICQQNHRWDVNKAKIQDGNYKSSSGSTVLLRRFLIEKYGYKCCSCGLDQWKKKPIPLNVHHKDGDSQNNLPSNLELLCLNCHGLTDNYGSKNNKSTRYYRYAKE